MASNRPSRELDKIIVRLPDGMRDRLTEVAKANNRSVNAEVVARLESSFTDLRAVEERAFAEAFNARLREYETDGSGHADFVDLRQRALALEQHVKEERSSLNLWRRWMVEAERARVEGRSSPPPPPIPPDIEEPSPIKG